MRKFFLAVLIATVSAISAQDKEGSIPVVDLQRDKPVDFEKEILPIFKDNCLACHNSAEAKGELVLESPTAILKGGESGPAVVPGKGSESLLLRVAARQEKPFMPPKNNKAGAVALTSDQLGLLKLWIEQGATGVVSTALGPVQWQPLPPSLTGITTVAITRDGQFAACGRANQIFIYHLPTKRLVTRLSDPALIQSGFAKGPGIADRDLIQSLAFNPDGNLLASGAYRSLKLWERKPLTPELTLPYVAAGAAQALAVSSDGNIIATGGEDGTVKTWSANDGKLLQEFRGHTASVNAVSFSPDDSRLASGSSDQSIRVWNLRNPAPPLKLESPSPVEAVAWVSADQLASGGGDNFVRLWKVEPSSIKAVPVTRPQVSAIGTTSDGKVAGLIALDGVVQILSMPDLKPVKELTISSTNIPWAAFFETGLVSVDAAGNIRITDIPTGNLKGATNLTAQPDAVVFAPARSQVAVALPGSPVSLWTAGSGELKLDKQLHSLTNKVRQLAFSSDASMLFVLGADGTISAIKISDSASIYSIKQEVPATKVTVSPDGKLLATSGEKAELNLWNAADGTPAARPLIGGFKAPVRAVAFSPDSRKLSVGLANGQIVMVNPATAVLEQSFEDANGGISAVIWIGLDSLLTLGSANSVHAWKPAIQTTLPGHGQPVTALAVVQGKTEFLSGSKDGLIKHWNLANNQVIREMNHGGEITGLAVRPDAKRFASSGLNNTAKLWNAENGQMVAELKGDRVAREFATEMERALTFSKCEVEYQKAAVDGAEKAEKSESEALKKASEAREKAEKSFTEKAEAFKKAGEAKAASEKALEDLKTAIAVAKEKKPALEKAQQDAAAQVKPLAEKAGQAKAALDAASAQKEAAYQALLDTAFQAKLAHLSALEAKSKAEKEPTNSALIQTRDQAAKLAEEKLLGAQSSADRYAGTKSSYDAATASKAEADKVLAEAEGKSKSAAESFAANEKIIVEADKNTKDAEEKIKNSAKQLAEADSALKTADGVKGGAIQAFESTQAALKKAGQELAKIRQEQKAAEEAQTQANQVLETARKSAADTEKPAHAVVFTSDNQFVLWGGEDGMIRAATSEHGQPAERFQNHTARVLGLAALPNGRFVSASADQSAKVWSSTSVWELKQVIGDGSEKSPLIDRVLALDFSPDGKLLASSGGFPSRSGEIKIWNVAEGTLFKEFKDPHSDTVVALDFSPDQKHLASGGSDKFVRVFQVDTGKQIKTFEGHTHHVQGVSWKRDQRTLASAGADNVIKIWDFASGEQRKTIQGFAKEITAVQFLLPTRVDRNFEALASSGDRQVKFVKEDGNHTRGFGGAGEFVTFAAATPDGSIVVAGALDGVLRVWKGENAESIATFDPPKEEGHLANK